MKLIKFLLWFIIIVLLAILVWQNQDYFMAATALHLDLKVESWNWTIPELQTGIYFAICFALGLLLAGFKAVVIKFRLNKNIKAKDKQIVSLNDEINSLKTELEVFKNDPYLKKASAAQEPADTTATPESESANTDGSDPKDV